MVAEYRHIGPHLLRDLSRDYGDIKRAYIEVAKAKRELYHPDLGLDGVIDLAEHVKDAVHESFPKTELSPRQIDKEAVSTLFETIKDNNGGLILMRHGVQSVAEEERRLLEDPHRKIRLMQLPYNFDDPASAQSVAEASSLAIIMMHISKLNNIPVEIITSGNRRAAEIGAVMSVSNSFHVAGDDRLTCVNYPTDKTDEELDLLLGRENKGSLVWERGKIDSVCGVGTFDQISSNIGSLVSEYQYMPRLTVGITHTPQTNAADLIAGDNPIRMPELGMRLFSGNESIRFPSNIFIAS
ncbi:hypothetical protein BH09PAT1_BH09PAT1_8650 [soil metagenome]